MWEGNTAELGRFCGIDRRECGKSGTAASVDVALTGSGECEGVRYLLVPVGDLDVQRLIQALEADGLTEGEWVALSRSFERAIQEREVLVTYALLISGKPSSQ